MESEVDQIYYANQIGNGWYTIQEILQYLNSCYHSALGFPNVENRSVTAKSSYQNVLNAHYAAQFLHSKNLM